MSERKSEVCRVESRLTSVRSYPYQVLLLHRIPNYWKCYHQRLVIQLSNPISPRTCDGERLSRALLDVDE